MLLVATAAGTTTIGAKAGTRVAQKTANTCQQALPRLDRELERHPDNARARLVDAKCALELKRYDHVVEILEPLAQDAYPRSDAFLYLGIARFHQNDLAGAAAALDAAAKRPPERAEVPLYRGLIALAQKRPEDAVHELEDARRRDPKRVEPVASYYTGIAWILARDPAKAVAAFRRVEALDSKGPWGKAAKTRLVYLQRVPPKRPGPRGAWLSLTAGFEYDDNVLLRDVETPISTEISGQQDVLGTWRMNAGTPFFQTPRWSAGGGLLYFGTTHRDLHQFDVDYPVAVAWVDRRFGRRLKGQIRYDYGHAWVDGRSILDSQELESSLFVAWSPSNLTRFFARPYVYSFHLSDRDVLDGTGVPFSSCPSPSDLVCGPPGVREDRSRNRDGYGLHVGFEHAWSVAPLHSVLRAGYAFDRYWARGDEQDFESHEVHARWQTALPWKLMFHAEVSRAYRPYDAASSIPNPKQVFRNVEYPVQSAHRRDNVLTTEVGIERPVTRTLSISFLYQYTDNGSNVVVYDYTRQVVGTYLTLQLGR